LNKTQLIRHTDLVGIAGGSPDLVFVDVEPRDVAPSEFGNLASGPSDTATYVQDFHAPFNVDGMSKVMLVTGNSFLEGFTTCGPVEMEALPKSEFVEVSREIIVPGETPW
jgi:hypothetical protein